MVVLLCRRSSEGALMAEIGCLFGTRACKRLEEEH